MIVNNLIDDFYLFNNAVQVVVNGFGTQQIKSLKVKVENLDTTNYLETVLYPILNEFTFDVSEMVKPTFEVTNNNISLNLNEIKITLTATDSSNATETQIVNKFFVRGGNYRGNYPTQGVKSNYLPTNVCINELITEFIPIWAGYNEFYYQISNNDFEINKTPKTLLQDSNCNAMYCKFLNQYGTYSYWLFDAYEITVKTKDLDSIQKIPYNFNSDNFFDLGVTQEKSIKLSTRIKNDFNNLMLHLALSPEVYIFENGFEIKVKQKSKTWTKNEIDKMFKYDFVFEYDNVLNPTLLW
jgi:hypothetical protein